MYNTQRPTHTPKYIMCLGINASIAIQHAIIPYCNNKCLTVILLLISHLYSALKLAMVNIYLI